MIQIHVNPSRVEKVVFVSTSEMEEEFDWAAWIAIKPYVNRMDRRLRKIVRSLKEQSAEKNE